MIDAALSRTTTEQAILARHPSDYAAAKSKAVDAAVEKYGERWSRNLADSYTASLNRDELRADCAAINNGDRATVAAFASKVAPEMRARSEALLVEAADDALNGLMPLLR